MTEIFHKMPDTSFRFSIDRGGTFTDVYAEVPGESEFRVIKLLSEDPQNYADAVSYTHLTLPTTPYV